jgi:hypothetical protein
VLVGLIIGLALALLVAAAYRYQAEAMDDDLEIHLTRAEVPGVLTDLQERGYAVGTVTLVIVEAPL